MFNSIQKRIVFAFLFLFALSHFILSAFFYKSMEAMLTEGVMIRARAVSEPVFGDLNRELGTLRNKSAMEGLLEDFMARRSRGMFLRLFKSHMELKDVFFVNRHGIIISSLNRGTRMFQQIPAQTEPSVIELSGSMEVFIPYAPEGRVLGGLAVTLSKDKLLSERKKIFRGSLAIFLVFLFAGGGCVYFLSGTISRPLKRLAAVIDRTAAGTFERPLETERADEIGSLARSFESMRATISKNMKDLDEKNKGLKQAQKMETAAVMAGGFAHDFNNNLSIIKGCTSLIDLEIGREFSQEELVDAVEEYNEMIREATARASSTVKQMLSIASESDFEKLPVNLKDSVHTVARICRNSFGTSVSVICSLPDVPAHTVGDPLQVEQALINLCINAVHAMTIMRKDQEPAGGTLSLALGREESVSGRTGPFWVIKVSDTGVGIEKENMERIFDPFFTTKDRDCGTGLGLTMVYNTVRDNGGFVHIESVPGQGTDVSVFFPAVDHVEAAGAERPCMDEAEKGGGIILIVDDDRALLKVSGAMLERCGYDVIAAESGQQCVDILSRRKGDISAVILDMDMPGKSGKKVYGEIKDISPDVKVILSSGFRKDEQVESLMRMGVRAFLQKPYTIDELSEIVQRTVKEERKS